jgi:hypothetical protein
MVVQGLCSARDIVVAIFTWASEEVERREGRGGRCQFTAHNHELQKEINELRNTGRYGILLTFFVFSDSGPEPFSPALEEVLPFSLHRYYTGSPETFIVDDAVRKECHAEMYPGFSIGAKEEIREIACKLLEKIPYRIVPR